MPNRTWNKKVQFHRPFDPLWPPGTDEKFRMSRFPYCYQRDASLCQSRQLEYLIMCGCQKRWQMDIFAFSASEYRTCSICVIWEVAAIGFSLYCDRKTISHDWRFLVGPPGLSPVLWSAECMCNAVTTPLLSLSVLPLCIIEKGCMKKTHAMGVPFQKLAFVLVFVLLSLPEAHSAR